MSKQCAVAGCGLKYAAKGFCHLHYNRVKYHGSTDRLPPYDRSGDKNPKWKGGQTHDGNGRIYLYRPDHPYANKWGYVYRYRIHMEKKLGRLLDRNEIVHHKDGDCSNDDLDNLEIVNSSGHSKIHNQNRTRNKKGQYE